MSFVGCEDQNEPTCAASGTPLFEVAGASFDFEAFLQVGFGMIGH